MGISEIKATRRGRTIIIACLTTSALIAVLALSLRWTTTLSTLFLGKNNRIQDLQGIPNGPVRLQGVVTYVDALGKRFWIQDETGALAIAEDPIKYGIHTGQVVRVDTRKTHSYNPFVGLASSLTDWKIVAIKGYKEMPSPVVTTLKTLPQKEKNGIRVQIEGVVHYAFRDGHGQTQIAIGQAGQEAWVTVPEVKADLSRWRNVNVRVIGVSETVLNPQEGFVTYQHIWVQSSADIQIRPDAPPAELLYTVRSLYLDF